MKITSFIIGIILAAALLVSSIILRKRFSERWIRDISWTLACTAGIVAGALVTGLGLNMEKGIIPTISGLAIAATCAIAQIRFAFLKKHKA